MSVLARRRSRVTGRIHLGDHALTLRLTGELAAVGRRVTNNRGGSGEQEEECQ